MTKKRILTWIVLFACSFLFLFPISTFAEEESKGPWINPYDALFNWHDVTEDVTGEEPLFAKYDLVRYTLDIDIGSTIGTVGVGGGSNVIVNFLLYVMLLLMGGACLLVIRLTDWAFNQNYLQGEMIDQVDAFVDALKEQLFFGELFSFTVFFLGVSLIFAFGRNEDIAGKLLKVIFNLVIAFTLLSNMGLIIKGMYAIGQWGSKAVFTAFGSIPGMEMKEYVKDNPGRNAMFNVYNGFFKYNFYKPWQLANFGLTAREDQSKWTAAEKQVDDDSKQVLGGNQLWWEVEKATKNNASVMKSLWNGIMPSALEIETDRHYGYMAMTPAGIPFRTLIVGLTFVIGTAYGCFLLAIAGTTIFLQFFLILLALLAPLSFLMVLIPEYGDQVLVKWVQTVIGAAVYWILASLLLCLVLFLQHMAYEVSDNWFAAMFLQIIILFTFFRFRGEAAEFLPAVQMAAYSGAETAFFDKFKSTVDNVAEKAVEGGTMAVVGGAAIATGNPALMTGAKSRMGQAGQGILKEAMSIRKNAGDSGVEKPSMRSAIGMAVTGKKLPKPNPKNMDPQAQQQAAAAKQRGQQLGTQGKLDATSGKGGGVNALDSEAARAAAALQRISQADTKTTNNETREQAVQRYSEGRHEIRGGDHARLENGKLLVGEGSKTNHVGTLGSDGNIRHTSTKEIIGNVQSGQVHLQNAQAIGMSHAGPVTAPIQSSPTILHQTQGLAGQQPVQVAGGGSNVHPQTVSPGQGMTVINNYYNTTTHNYTQSSGSGVGGPQVIRETNTRVENITKESTVTKETIGTTGGSTPQQQPTVNPSTGQPIQVDVNVNHSGTGGTVSGGNQTPSNINVTHQHQNQGPTFNQSFTDQINVQPGSGGDSGTGGSSSSSPTDHSPLSGFSTGNYAQKDEAERIAEQIKKQNREKKGLLERLRGLFSGKD